MGLLIAFFGTVCYNLPVIIKEVFPLADILLLAGPVLCVAFYLYAYFAAQQPKHGTLEWIAMQEKPTMTRENLLNKLHWSDSLWGLLAMVMAAGTCLGFMACVDMSILTTALLAGSLWLPLVSTTISALLVYLTAKALTGKAGLCVLATLLYCLALPFVSSPNLLAVTALMLGSFLLLLLWLHKTRTASWLSLLASALLLGAALWMHPSALLFAGVWTLSVLFGGILRMKTEDDSFWYLLGSLLSGVVLAAAVPVVTELLSGTPVSTLPARFFAMVCYFPSENMHLLPLFLPAVGLTLAAIPAYISGISSRRDAKAVLLLLFTVGAIPMFLFTSLELLYPAATLALAYITGRIYDRNYPGAAYVTALTAPVLTVITIFFTLMEVTL